jgi:hypothetical protein
MVRADELYNEVTHDASGKGASQGMFVGCFVDTATGWITYTCEGKETSRRFKVMFHYVYRNLYHSVIGDLNDHTVRCWLHLTLGLMV